MYECDAHRLFELKFGHIINHGFHAFDGLVNREGGVVVVFHVDKQYGCQVFADDEIDSVLPVDIKA